METLGDFGCRDCRMSFHSLELLEKHKVFFCIGSEVGDPVALRQGAQEHRDPRRGDGKGVYPKQARTPDLIRLRGQRGLHPGNPHTGGAELNEKREDRRLLGVTESSALQNLTEEFQKLRMSIEESMPNFPKWPAETELSGRQRGHREKLKEMTEQHGRQLADIQAQTHLLEQQREEIARQLGVLAGQVNTAHLETLLLDLRSQEERNEEALGELKERITSLQAPLGVKESSAPMDFPGPDTNDDDRKKQHVTFDLISSVDGPLSVQIRALRLAYMQSGGSDPAVLAQMHDLQAEAHTLEQALPVSQDKARGKRSKPSQRVHNPQVLEMERENQRLEEEIFRIQLAKEKHRGEEAMGSDLHHLQREHLHHMASLQAEIESLRRDVQRAREDPRQRRPPPPPPPLPFLPQAAMHPLGQMHAPPALPQPRPHSSVLGRRVIEPLDSLGPAPYDPAAGFVIFFDLVLGVDATLQALRLVSALYSGGQEVGRPTPLPPVPCQPGGVLPYAHCLPPGNYALLSVKQPVPRMQPSGSFSLVVEVQAAGGLDGCGQEIERLVSCGWARLDLFDPHNQVRSGHWRVPVRCLPVRPSLNPGQLNSIPQVGNMELCLRVVNARDGDVQTLAKIDASNTSQYKYPSVVSAHPALLQANPPPPLPTVQPAAAHHFPALLPYSAHEDPPPKEEPSQSVIDPLLLKNEEQEKGVREMLQIIVDRVSGASEGEGGLRLTGYSQNTGKVLMFGDAGLHCCTSTVRSSTAPGNLIFGEQQVALSGLTPREDMILLLRFYFRPAGSSVPFSGLVKQRESPPWELEDLVGNLAEMGEFLSAWGVVRLAHTPKQSQRQTPGQTRVSWNAGTHSVPLYKTPVPPAMALTNLPEDCLGALFEPYRSAQVRVHIFSGDAPLLPIPPPSSNTATGCCVKVCVEGALNLPWAGFTLGLCSLNPPGAFYHGVRWATYDPPIPLLHLDPSSSKSAPRWKDGHKVFHERGSHENLTVIVHLHAVSAVSSQDHSDPQSPQEEQGDGLVFSLEDQCWAAAPVSPEEEEGQGQVRRHQVPLYHGAPSPAVLKALANGSSRSMFQKLQKSGQVKLLPGASVFVLVGNYQREQEPSLDNIKDTDTTLLPVDQLALYSPQSTPSQVSTTPLPEDTLTSQLATQYTQLVYRSLGQHSALRAQLQMMGSSA